MAHTLSTPKFSISCDPQVFESDIACPSNTTLYVSIHSDGFCANANMDIDIKAFAQFAADLKSMYDNLKGAAIIQEPFGHQMFIRFEMDRRGYIHVNGKVNNCGKMVGYRS